MERIAAHTILTEHLPERDPRWLWLRDRCADCRQRYPCLMRRGALAEVAAGIRDQLTPESGWLSVLPARRIDNRGRW